MNIIPIFYDFTNIFNEKIVFTKSGKYDYIINFELLHKKSVIF